MPLLSALPLFEAIRLFRKWRFPQEHQLPPYIVGLVVAVFLVASSYSIFEDKKNQLLAVKGEIAELKARLGKKNPDFKLSFYQAYRIPEYPILMALGSISNAGEVASIAHDFELTVGGNRARS